MTSNNDQHNVVQRILREYLQGDDLDSAVSLWDRQYRLQPLDKLNFFVFEIATTSALRSLRKNILIELERGLQQVEEITPLNELTAKEVISKEATTKETSENKTTVNKTTANQATLDTHTSETKPHQSHMRKIKSSDVEEKTASTPDLQTQAASVTNKAINTPIVTMSSNSSTTSAKMQNGLSYFLQQLLSQLQAEKAQDIRQLINECLQETALPLYVRRDFLQWYEDRQDLASIVEKPDYAAAIVNVLYSVLCEYFGPVKSDRLMSLSIQQAEQQYPEVAIKQFL